MTLRPILTLPDARLREVAARVTEFDDVLKTLAEDMLETMYDAPGRGLAGPQIGAMQRIFVMDCGWKEGAPSPVVLINPKIQWQSDSVVVDVEQCLSIPDVSVTVERPAEVRMRWSDLKGRAVVETFFDFAARCALHELDHLDGRLCIDYPDLGPVEEAMA